MQWQASPRQSQSTLHLPGIAELRYDCCRCRKFDPVGDWRGIGQSCVGCGISAGCSSAWRGPVSVTSSAGSRNLGAQTADHRVATGQAGHRQDSLRIFLIGEAARVTVTEPIPPQSAPSARSSALGPRNRQHRRKCSRVRSVEEGRHCLLLRSNSLTTWRHPVRVPALGRQTGTC